MGSYSVVWWKDYSRKTCRVHVIPARDTASNNPNGLSIPDSNNFSRLLLTTEPSDKRYKEFDSSLSVNLQHTQSQQLIAFLGKKILPRASAAKRSFRLRRRLASRYDRRLSNIATAGKGTAVSFTPHTKLDPPGNHQWIDSSEVPSFPSVPDKDYVEPEYQSVLVVQTIFGNRFDALWLF